MAQPAVRSLRSRTHRWRALPPAAVAWAAGLLAQFHATLLSGFAQMPGEWNDARFNNFILEHGYRWLLRAPADARLWDAPAFYPVPNTFAYSDVLLSVAPVYWLFRAAGAAPDTSYQLLLLASATLNFVAWFVFLRRAPRVGPTAASVGAFLFAFGASRTAQVLHIQMVPQFFTVGALYALWRLFERGDADGRRAAALRVAAFFLCVVAQLYQGYYLAWFLCFALLLATLWALVVPAWRAALFGVVRRHALAIAGSAAAAAALAAPLAVHYLRVAHDVGMREFPAVATMLPRPASWLYLGDWNFVYGRLARLDVFRAIPTEYEQRLGFGYVTAAVAAAGLWTARRRSPVALMLATSATLVALVTWWAPWLAPWAVVFRVVPGAAALRAVSRIGMMLLIPASLGVALAVERIVCDGDGDGDGDGAARVRPPSWRRRGLVALLALAVAVEQAGWLHWYDRDAARERAATVARAIPAGCAAFLYTPVAPGGDPWWYHGDAMWAALARGVPTVNGYSGNVPHGWPFYATIAHTPREDSVLTSDLRSWANRWRVDADAICRVRLADPRPELRVEAPR